MSPMALSFWSENRRIANARTKAALGLAWLQVDPGSRRIEVAIGTPERVRPSRRLEVPIRLTGASRAATAAPRRTSC